MRVCRPPKLQHALKRQYANNLVAQAIRDLVLARRRLLAKNSKSLSRPSGKPLMRVCRPPKPQHALKRRLTNSLVGRVIRDLVLARHRLQARNNKLQNRRSSKLLMRVCRLPKRQHALKRRLTNSLVGRVIRDLVLARRRLQARNSKSLSRHSGRLLMRVCRLPKRLLVLIKLSVSSCL